MRIIKSPSGSVHRKKKIFGLIFHNITLYLLLYNQPLCIHMRPWPYNKTKLTRKLGLLSLLIDATKCLCGNAESLIQLNILMEHMSSVHPSCRRMITKTVHGFGLNIQDQLDCLIMKIQCWLWHCPYLLCTICCMSNRFFTLGIIAPAW